MNKDDYLLELKNKTIYFYEIPEEIQDRNFCLEAIKIDCDYLSYFPEKFQNDKEIILEGLNSYFNLIKNPKYNDYYFIDELTEFLPVFQDKLNDKNFFLSLISTDSRFLEYLPDSLKNDSDIFLESLKTYAKTQKKFDYDCPYSIEDFIEYIPNNFFSNKNIKQIISLHHDFLEFFSEKFKDNESIMDVLGPLHPLSHRPSKYITRKDVLKEIKNNGMLLSSLPFQYTDDDEIVHLALTNMRTSIMYASERIRLMLRPEKDKASALKAIIENKKLDNEFKKISVNKKIKI